MLRILFLQLLVCFAYPYFLSAQADGCSSATLLTVDAVCTPVNGTTVGATETIPGCTGTADDDVWYRFVATSTAHTITVTPSAGMDAVMQLFSGTCSSLVSLVCRDNSPTGTAETITYSGLSIGATYRIRVYHYGAGSGTGTFSICITGAPAPPSNDNCLNATSLTVNATCISTNGTLTGATQSLAGCSGTADEDVWYSFVATNSIQTVAVSPVSNLDLVLNVFSGTCGALTSLHCVDNTLSGGNESIQLVGLTVGSTYFIRVYDYHVGNTGNFQICVTGTPTPVPSNDQPCNAVQLPPVTSNCQYLEFSNVGATATMTAPTPATCVGGGAPQIGGFNAATADVWFAITVPVSGHINITNKPNMGAGSINDGVMALYSGTCSALTQIACSDDNNYPGTVNDMKPMINTSGLTPGSTVYLRYWGFNTTTGNFGFCVTTATNDACSNALYICDINGYSASTSAAFTPDRPGNMHGNNENAAGVNLVDGTNSGGPFGFYPPSNVPGPFSSPAIDVNIENNSWIRFTAAATTATLTVNITDCFVGNYPNGGIQMQIFSSTGCTSFVPISNFEENSTQFIITANGLTVGNDYILMVDGYAGDICNYTISANSGVQFPDIPDVPAICFGESVTLTAPAGADSYLWYHDGSSSQTVTVSPGSTQTYYCEVTGLCNYKQTLDVQVTVKPSPIIEFNLTNNHTICEGESITLTVTGADTYLWGGGQTNPSITVSPNSQTTYSVTGTINDCDAVNSITINVNPLPTTTITPSATGPICNGASVTLTAGGADSYLWSNGSTSSSITVSPSSTTTYSLEGTTNGCSSSVNYQVVVTPLPTVAITPSVTGAICSGNSVTLTAGVASSYAWNTGSTQTSITVSPATTTSYSVTGTSNGCSSTANYTVSVNQPPVISGTAVSTPSDCSDSTGTISGLVVSSSSATAVVWTNAGNVVVGSTLDINDLPAGSYMLTVTDVNNCSAQYGPVLIVNPNAPAPPTVSVSAATICDGGTVTFTAASQSGATFEWTGTQGVVSNNAQFTLNNISASEAGNYCVTVVISGCQSPPACQSISLFPDPNIDITSSGSMINVCEGGAANLNATGGVSYSWTGPNAFTGTGNSVTVQPVNAASVGYYYVTGVDANGCSNADSVFITMLNNPDISISSDVATGVYCNHSTAELTATGAQNYTWEGPNNLTYQGGTITISNVTNSNTGWYVVTGTDVNNCSSSDSIQIELSIPDFQIDAGNDSIVCPGESVHFSAMSGGSSYSWEGPQGHITSNQNFVLTNAVPPYSGWYYVTVTDSNNCSATDSTYLSVEPNASCLVIPDLVSPDGDNLNDTWTIPGLENFPNVSVEIYNRWGNLIYTTDNYPNNWNGEVNHGATIGSSGKVPVGTYFYIMVLNDQDNTPPYKGYIEVQY
jgi:gliding motility-associated-like protein